MKNLLTYILIIFSLTSCLEQLEDLPQSFERVYGTEGTSVVSGMIKRSNGHLLMYGRETKPAFNDGTDFTIPFIIETDEFGNEVQSRNYAFYKGEYDINLTNWDEVDPGWYNTNQFDAIRSSLFEIKELSNGTFFCLGTFRFRPKNTWWPANYDEYDYFYLVLDENLEPIKWGLFNDTALEGPGMFWQGLESNDIYELPSGEIIFLSAWYVDFDNGSYRNDGFAIYKFSPSTEIIKVWRYPETNPDIQWQAQDFVVDTKTSTMLISVNQVDKKSVIGPGFASIVNPSLFQIDISSGEIIDQRKYNIIGSSYTITKGDNGYVSKVYNLDPGDNIADFNREYWGSLLFVGENLDSVKLIPISETNNILTGTTSLLRTRDGGYVAAFNTNGNNGLRAILIKTDSDGNVLWRYEEKENTAIIDVLEMDDGGIVYSVRRDYNGIGDRITLVKLSPDGKL